MKPFDSFEKANAKQWDEESTVSMAPSARTLNFERSNAKEWDEQSSVSFAPSANEFAHDDDNESLLIDFGDFPPLPTPQRAPAARTGNHNQGSMTSGIAREGQPPVHSVTSGGYQQNGNTNHIRPPPGFENHFPTRQPAPTQSHGQRGGASTRGTGRPARTIPQQRASAQSRRGRLASHVNATGRSRHLHQSATTQSNGHRQGTTINGTGRPLTQNASRQISAVQHQQNGNRDRHGVGYHVSSGDSSSGSTEILTSGKPRDRRPSGTYQRGPSNASGKSSKTVWPEPPPLLSTRRGIYLENQAQKESERMKYLKDPSDQDSILAYAFYIWPEGEGSVLQVLGSSLEVLNATRINHKVWITYTRQEGMPEVLKISSDSQNSDIHIAKAIKNIRGAIGNARAKATLAKKYFIVPPTANGMRALIGPKTITTKTEMVDDAEKTTNSQCNGIQLVGSKLSEKETKDWRKEHTRNRENYVRDFEGLLTRSLTELKDLKEWMRMRVHFGHLVLTNFPSKYTTCQMSLKEFTQMMGHSRTRGEIDRILPAMVAMKLGSKVVEWPERFRPAQARLASLEEMNFKDTEIISVTTNDGNKLRVEAEIDVRYDDEGSVEYQLGSYEVFRDDHSSRRVELSIIDPERQVDCSLQLITDSKEVLNRETSAAFQKLIEGSISSKTRMRADALGLPYPDIRPQYAPALTITKVVVRSVIQFALKSSGFVVEIALHRTWLGPATKWEPELHATVSMFHPQWDLDMLSIENTTNEREWDPRLNNFFCNGAEEEGNGFENFLSEVQTIQGFLSDATKDFEIQAASEAAAEAAREAARVAAETAENEAAQETDQAPPPPLLDI